MKVGKVWFNGVLITMNTMQRALNGEFIGGYDDDPFSIPAELVFACEWGNWVKFISYNDRLVGEGRIIKEDEDGMVKVLFDGKEYWCELNEGIAESI